MDTSQDKIVQYLNEAHATEPALIRVLQSQIAMTPAGSYRSGLETHLRETRERRLAEIDRVEGEVRARLKREINYWDGRAEELALKEQAGKPADDIRH